MEVNSTNFNFDIAIQCGWITANQSKEDITIFIKVIFVQKNFAYICKRYTHNN